MPIPTKSSDHNEKQIVDEKNKIQSSSHLADKSKENRMVRTTTENQLVSNLREIEKDKLINKLSKSQTNQLVKIQKAVNRVENLTNKVKNTNFIPSDREKEKDRLAEIFASSEYQYQKPSNYQISKNLNSEISLKSNKEAFEAHTQNKDSNSAFDQFETNYKTRNTKPILQDKAKSSNQKQNIPKIVISEFGGSNKTRTVCTLTFY